MKRFLIGVSVSAVFACAALASDGDPRTSGSGDIVPTGADIYLNAAALGGLGTGTSWANAYTNVADAIAALNASPDGHTVLRIAGGVYHMPSAQSVTKASFAILGGYKAASDGDLTCDPAEYQTIFTGDKAINNLWGHITPKLGEYSFASAATAQKMFVGGKMNPPVFTGDFDNYCIWVPDGLNAVQLTVASGAGGTVGGIVFTHVYRSTNVKLAEGSTGTTLTNCVFYGNYTQGSCFVDASSAVDLVVGCRFLYNLNDYGCTVMGVQATTVKDCEITGNRSQSYYGTAQVSGGDATFENCVFTRNLAFCNSDAAATSSYGIGNICNGVGTRLHFLRCVITNNYSYATVTSYGMPLMSLRDGQVTDCVIANNRSEVKPVDGFAYTLCGSQYATGCSATWSGTLFSGNVIAAPALNMEGGSYALAIVGNNMAMCNSLINCTFVSNRVEYVAADGVTPVLSRGVVASALSDGANAACGLANCTFIGPATNGVHDVVQFGTYHSKTFNVVNSIFTVTDSERADPFSVAVPSYQGAQIFNVLHCSIKNMIPAFLPESFDISIGLEYDPVPLAPVEVLGSGHSVYRPAVRVPGIRTTCDVSTNAAVIPNTFAFRLPGGGPEWQALVPAISASVGEDLPAISDALGTARTFGSYTRGAVQALTDAAEAGYAFVVRRDPFVAGVLSDPPGASQTVAPGNAIAVVTATPVMGSATVNGWFDADETLLESSATLSGVVPTNDMVVTVKFSTMPVTVVLNLDGNGTFDANGQPTISVATSAGAAFPDVPPFTVAEGMIFVSWEEFPATVPESDTALEYHARIVTKSLRIVYLVPGGAGKADGSSWADAFGDLAPAYADAGIHRGEVWIKEGTYSLGSRIPMLPNVTLRGGFAGTETSAGEADPAARPTVISGDVKGDNKWRPDNTSTVANWIAVRDPETGAFNACNPGAANSFWIPGGNNADDTLYGFANETGAATNGGFAGLTFTGFKYAAIYSTTGLADGLVVSNCAFIANNTSQGTASYPVLVQKSSVVLSGCAFIGNCRGCSLTSAIPTTSRVENCTFAENVYRLLGIAGSTSRLDIAGCIWRGNYSDTALISFSPGTYYSVMLADSHFTSNRLVNTASIGTYATDRSCFFDVERCSFIGNSVTATQSGTVGASTAGTYYRVLFRGCYFGGNTLTTSATGGSYAAATAGLVGAYGTLCFYDCTFEENTATASKSGSYVATVAFSQYWGSTAMFNCTCVDNVYTAVDAGHAAEFAMITGSDKAPNTKRIMNCVFDTSRNGHKAISILPNTTIALQNCAISGYVEGDPALGLTVPVNISTADARLAPFTKTGANGALARGLSASSPFARGGTPVWKATNGYIYYLAGSTWICSSGIGGNYTLANGLGVGLSTNNPPLPDAFDMARAADMFAYGPLNPPPRGTSLILR